MNLGQNLWVVVKTVIGEGPLPLRASPEPLVGNRTRRAVADKRMAGKTSTIWHAALLATALAVSAPQDAAAATPPASVREAGAIDL
jgi:hypothetical protein